ncbi:hypothetical protein [Massilia sp.]|uniref:hypothetical protein n=1 Tax=Massilia sp. TaxID=1882437 RepID=UPI00289E27CA|nr:hypothetical protein [Massilia sp.]
MISTPTPLAWTELFQLPLHQRLLPLPPVVRDFVHQVNLATGVDAVPEAAGIDPDLQADLEAALAGMPAAVRALVAPRLLGICVGRGLGSCGITDIVVDADDGRLLGCIVLLDLDLMGERGANAWATWKDNLPFHGGPGFTVDTALADAHDDTRAGALQFLLLHEFGHVLSADGDFLPRWWEPVPQRAFPFLDLSWTTDEAGRFVARAGSDFDLRGVVDFYGVNKLESDALVSAYAGLELSDFPSLYGATNPYDDFAECFATYVHAEMMGRPYVLRIDHDGRPQAWLESFWNSPRSAPKRAFMQALLGHAANDTRELAAA